MVQAEATAAATTGLTISVEYDLPVGAGFRAIRSPKSAPPPLANQDSVCSDLSSKAALTPSGSCDSLDIQEPPAESAAAPHRLATQAKDDHARRAQTRVTERKRTELEKKQEQEKERVRKQESSKMKKELDQQLRQRRRAEIYALNAILRQLQQQKMAAFVNAHIRRSGGGGADGGQQQPLQDFAAERDEGSLVQSIGV